MQGCKLTHDKSIWIDGRKITVVGGDYMEGYAHWKFETTEILSDPVFIDEGLVHCRYGVVGFAEIRCNSQSNFCVRVMG